jgi:hypothetical protein
MKNEESSGNHLYTLKCSLRRQDERLRHLPRTLLHGGIVYIKVEVICLTQVIGQYDLFFQVKNGDPGAIEGHPRLIPLGFELVEN